MSQRKAIRVLHAVRNLDVGGLEVGVVNLIHGLHGPAFRQAVCCLEHRGKLADQLPDGVPAWSCAAPGTVLRRAEVHAARLMRAFRPDIVHARNCGAWIDAGIAWLLAGCPGRLVFSIHGFDRVESIPWRWALACRQLARVTHTLVAVSAETAVQFAREAGISGKRFHVLHSGVDTDRYRPAENGSGRPHGGRLILGCVGRLVPIKGHDLLIAALGELVHQQGRDLELRLVGDGPSRAELERLTREHRLEERVRFLGTCHDMPRQLRELDLFVLPSLREGRPTSIMEAMACGLPVVASRVGSVEELVEDQRTGLLVEPGSVPALVDGIKPLVEDARRREQFGAAARAKAVADLSLHRMVQNYRQMYERTLRG